jgi:putative hydrolase of HD superfamily
MKLRELLERLNNLKHIPRTGWLMCNVPLKEVEDVAQHTFDVVTITLLLADELGPRGKKLNRERALSMALMHDWAEASIGDFPNIALKHIGRRTKELMEYKALNDIVRGLPQEKEYLAMLREYNEKSTLEAKLVCAADYLSMLVQALKYRERGNRSRQLGELWRAVKNDLAPYAAEFKSVRELVTDLDKHYTAYH